MKYVLTLLVILGTAASVHAALLSENFDGAMTGWTNTMTVVATDRGNSLVGTNATPFVRASANLSSAVGSGSIYVQVDMELITANFRASAMALYDASGNGIVLNLDAHGANNYISSGACPTTDSGVTQFAANMHASTIDLVGDMKPLNVLSWKTVRYDINLDTGAISASVDGTVYKTGNASTILAAMGDITTFAIGSSRQVYLDNVVVDVPEPASLTLLVLSGLGMLIRRKR